MSKLSDEIKKLRPVSNWSKSIGQKVVKLFFSVAWMTYPSPKNSVILSSGFALDVAIFLVSAIFIKPSLFVTIDQIILVHPKNNFDLFFDQSVFDISSLIVFFSQCPFFSVKYYDGQIEMEEH